MSSLLSVLALVLISDPTLWFGAPIRLDAFSDPTIGNTDIASDGGSRICVVWDGREGAQPEMAWASVSSDAGVSWGIPRQLTDSEDAGPYKPRVCADTSGVFHAVWEDYRGPEPYSVYYSRSVDGGETWLQPNVRISIEGERCYMPAISCDDEGNLLVCVYGNMDDDRRVYSSHSTDGGLTWEIGTPVGDSTGPQYYAEVAFLEGSSFIAAWSDGRPTGGDNNIYCSISADGGASWMQPNIPVPTGGYPVQHCSIRMDYTPTGLYLSWISQFTTRTIHAYVHYQKSTDGGLTWLPEPVRVDAGDEDWRRYGGVWSPPGGPIFASWSERTGLEWPSWAICSMSPDGGMTWSDSPAVANPGTGEANTCALSGNDRDGSVYMCWNNQITGGVFFARGGVQESTSEDPGPSSRWITATPCPASGLVQIDIPDGICGQVQVIDTTGRQVAALDVVGCGDDLVWDSSGSPAGVYSVRLQSGTWSSTARVVVVH
ncbi:MAG TPA: exo-alpha-sialidase [Candidatus Fermentibacter daniensis]|nr:MAG: hypothetical protein AO396_05950 [Candidatus Fermentibacter daniensis]OQC68783.1 MAG: BNR/Asp-box repeat protein [candidate division Hyd24-12 bacterium ADurb.Bin004]KZD20225.1 MAG: hypothetical protein AO394_01340 [Candidatus Fermentibacter daniensis]NLI02442.1 hypothetical protein [Candidatus Fermentibacter daniensis]HOA05726.1 exo-alpha-sialidase [Candidatus Fermentibacter daniensis]